MKTILIFVMLNLLISGIAFGQWFISPSLGLNMVPLKENDAACTTFKLGPTIGVHSGTTFWKKWDLDIGLTANRRFSHYYSESETGELQILQDFLDASGGLGGALDGLGDDIVNTYEKSG